MTRFVVFFFVMGMISISLPARSGIEVGVGTSGIRYGISDGATIGFRWVIEEEEYGFLEGRSGMPWVVGGTQHSSYVDSLADMKKHYKLTLGKRVFDLEVYRGLYIFGDFGGAWTNVLSGGNSSYFMFHEKLGLRYERASVTISHTSNAGLSGMNYGENTLLAQYRF